MMQIKQMAEQSSAAGRESILDPNVVIRRYGVGDTVVTEASYVWSEVGEIVLPGSKVKGTACVHCWPLTQLTQPTIFIIEL